MVEDVRFDGYEKISYKEEMSNEAGLNFGMSWTKRPSQWMNLMKIMLRTKNEIDIPQYDKRRKT